MSVVSQGTQVWEAVSQANIGLWGASRARRQPIRYSFMVVKLNQHGVAGIAPTNGLEEAENSFLFATASVDASLYLIIKGLTKTTLSHS